MVRLPATYLFPHQCFPEGFRQGTDSGWQGNSGWYLCCQGEKYHRYHLKRPADWDREIRKRMLLLPQLWWNWKFFIRKLYQRRFVDNYGRRRCCKNRRKSVRNLIIHIIHIFKPPKGGSRMWIFLCSIHISERISSTSHKSYYLGHFWHYPDSLSTLSTLSTIAQTPVFSRLCGLWRTCFFD